MVNTLTMLLEILLYKERLIIVQGDKKWKTTPHDLLLEQRVIYEAVPMYW